MRPNQPKAITWWISLILGAVGVFAWFVTIPVLTAISVWLVVAGLVLLLLGTFIKGL
ncbi:MAG: hypothetical protein JW747_03880 [Candidatus Aminicenantes bacterium]|nr:hypothetical protein [Candidatus Aminicenantes bacterium]